MKGKEIKIRVEHEERDMALGRGSSSWERERNPTPPPSDAHAMTIQGQFKDNSLNALSPEICDYQSAYRARA